MKAKIESILIKFYTDDDYTIGEAIDAVHALTSLGSLKGEVKVGEIYDVLGDNLSYYNGADGGSHVDLAKLSHAVNDYFKDQSPQPEQGVSDIIEAYMNWLNTRSPFNREYYGTSIKEGIEAFLIDNPRFTSHPTPSATSDGEIEKVFDDNASYLHPWAINKYMWIKQFKLAIKELNQR